MKGAKEAALRHASLRPTSRAATTTTTASSTTTTNQREKREGRKDASLLPMYRCAHGICDCLRRTFCWEERESEQDDTFDELLFVPGEERDQVKALCLLAWCGGSSSSRSE